MGNPNCQSNVNPAAIAADVAAVTSAAAADVAAVTAAATTAAMAALNVLTTSANACSEALLAATRHSAQAATVELATTATSAIAILNGDTPGQQTPARPKDLKKILRLLKRCCAQHDPGAPVVT